MHTENCYYHVSPISNHTSISKIGVEPLKSRGKARTSWYVDKTKLAWALAHCSVRYGVPVSDLEVWILPTSRAKKMTRTCWSGVFQTVCNHRSLSFISSQEALEKIK